MRPTLAWLVILGWVVGATLGAPATRAAGPFPSILLVTVDTLRPDRLSGYGYGLPTSPNLDRLMAAGVRFTEARTVEPLTLPALASMITSLMPHEHGATRNGVSIRPDLPSFVKILARRGYETAAFVGNWTLRERMSGLAEHFDVYREVFSRKRWLIVRREATADDLTQEALAWLEQTRRAAPNRPFLLWVHYVEPHAPYRRQETVLAQLGLAPSGDLTASQRYDSEVAYVDRSIGELLAGVGRLSDPASTLTVFTADHGESLGEHGHWGHGRHLFEQGLRIPLSLTWPGRLAPGRLVAAPALIVDLPSTIFGVIGFPVPQIFGGFDWSPVLRGEAPAPADRVTFYEAHKGAVQPREEQGQVRRNGLLEVARLAGGGKEILRLTNDRRRLFDLRADAGEEASLVALDSAPSAQLLEWLATVRRGLDQADSLPPPELAPEDQEELRALGYVD